MTIRLLVAPDSFKGSLGAAEVAAALARGLAAAGVDSAQLPLADGGDGSVDAALSAGYAARPVLVAGAAGEPVEAVTAWSADGRRAVVEVANTCGLAQLPPDGLRPMEASSLGFGEAVRSVIEAGAAQVVLALGGSASTDGGMGLLTALGAQFLDTQGQTLTPAGRALPRVIEVDPSGLIDLSSVHLVVAGDVGNPLLGAGGAAAAYGPQKGATPAQVAVLEQGLVHWVAALSHDWPEAADLAARPGAGAAGGLGFAALLLGAELVSGADLFLDLLGFDAALADCTHVVTGEGRTDATTLAGKLPARVAARSQDRPVHLVSGRCELTATELERLGVADVHTLTELTDADPSRDPELSTHLLEQIGQTVGASLAAP